MKRLLTIAALFPLVVSGLSSIRAQDAVAEAVPVKEAAVAKPASDIVKSKDATARPLTVNIELLSNTRLVGVLTDNVQFTMQTSFGTATIPTAEIAAVRLAAKDDTTTTVVLLNGDSITGATDVKLVTVETEWGTAKINGASIQSIFFVPEVKWNKAAGISGVRWSLTDAKAPPANQQAAAAAPGANAAAGGRPVNQPQGVLSR